MRGGRRVIDPNWIKVGADCDRRVRDNHDVAGVFVRLDCRETPGDDVARGSTSQRLNSAPASRGGRIERSEIVEVLEGTGSRLNLFFGNQFVISEREGFQNEAHKAVAVAVVDSLCGTDVFDAPVVRPLESCDD
jgi:hypothetical protein